ncbi:MAG: universal stress protein [Planctomycetota bacterium]
MNRHGVLCAIDASDFDQRVVDIAASFARQFKEPLHLLHVTLSPDPMKAAWPAYLGAPDEFVSNHRLLTAIKPSIAGVEVQRHHIGGFPVGAVAGFAKRSKPRLLVLGKHHRTGLFNLAGSIAFKIMRRVTCPVIVVRHQVKLESDAETVK